MGFVNVQAQFVASLISQKLVNFTPHNVGHTRTLVTDGDLILTLLVVEINGA